jgi:mannose-1-phosphate guanylyltransferase
MDKEVFVIIMAGGRGERFWPQSRKNKPKQLLKLISDVTLIEQTINRLDGFVKNENIFVITNEEYKVSIQNLLSEIPSENIIGEPIGRDTAPCVALATGVVSAKAESSDAVMFLLPADQVIRDEVNLKQVFTDCINQAKSDNVVTIGVPPTFPSTGYGYIECGDLLDVDTSKTKFYNSLGFKEKPDLQTAEQFISKGNFFWNSGIFVWNVESITSLFQKYAPNLYSIIADFEEAFKVGKLGESLDRIYPTLEKISIDYAIMEKVENIVVAECTFDWDDVGSWTALRNQLPADNEENVKKGNVVSIDGKNNILVSDNDHLLAVLGVDDLVVVHTEDATLVCKSSDAQRIKEIVKYLESDEKYDRYL